VSTTDRWAWAEIDLSALSENVKTLAEQAGRAELWATVKANGYGHGAVEVARTALASGASGLCVALADEAHELRQAKITAPILIVSEQPETQHEQMLRDDVAATLYNEATISSYAAKAARLGVIGRVHLKVDTGMHRVGAPIEDALVRAKQIYGLKSLTLEGVYTHFAAADLPEHSVTDLQRQKFAEVLKLLEQNSLRPKYIHTANSAAAIREIDSGLDTGIGIARVGIAMYGIAPSIELESHAAKLKPVMSIHARVSHVQHLKAGEGISYGLRSKLESAATIATLPIGYADGISRRLWSVGGEVLIGGRRCPIIGVVTMDQLMVNCADAQINIGDHAVLLGTQGTETITANEIAARLESIGYEIVCGISSRVPRRYINTKK
jgi:alanine racemase